MSLRLRFGHFEVRPVERALWVDGRPAAVGARAFDLLMVLIEHRDRLVTKEELLDAVWPGLIVEENNLQTQVSTLRKLLGRDAIATVAGRGYRFAVALEADGAEHDASPEPSSATATPSLPSPPALVASTPPLPPRPAALIGRDDDLAALVALAADQRLVTVLGAGGIGKTALALAAAHALQQREAVAWVELAPVQEGGFVASAIAQVLRLPLGQGDLQSDGHGDGGVAALAQCLQARRLLLVIDNAEHVVDAVARLARTLLAEAPDVRLLVTSQAALHVDGERIFRLDALALPAPAASVDAALACGAIALFVDQAQAADRHFHLHEGNLATVIQLCAGLDGLALAIKLAAARLPLLGLDGVASRLGTRLKVFGGGARDAPSRQQTLRAAFDWSHGLLSPAEQTVFRRLGVFVGGFSLGLAQAVAVDPGIDEWMVLDILAALVERSMVTSDGAERYRLPEIAREYAALKLAEAGESEAMQRAHAHAVAALMAGANEAYWQTADAVWLARYAAEIDNLRGALDWAARHDPALAARTFAAATNVLLLLGLAAEGRRRWLALEPVIAASTQDDADGAREIPHFWLEGARLHWGVSSALMARFAEDALAGYHRRGDRRGVYLALRVLAASADDADPAQHRLLDEMATLEEPGWPPRLRSQRLLAEVSVLRRQGRLVEVRAVLEALLSLATPAGLDAVVSLAQSSLADVQLALGDLDATAATCRALLASPQPLSGNYALQVQATLGSALLQSAMPASPMLAEARAVVAGFAARSKSRGWEWFGLYADLLALLAARDERPMDAARLIGHADARYAGLGQREPNATRSRDLAAQAVEAAGFDAATLARLAAEGARFSEDEACAVALGSLRAG